MAETAKIAEKIAKALIWPVVEMTLCAVIVLINAPMKNPVLISPIASSPTPFCLRSALQDAMTRPLPIKSRLIPKNSGPIERMILKLLAICVLSQIILHYPKDKSSNGHRSKPHQKAGHV